MKQLLTSVVCVDNQIFHTGEGGGGVEKEATFERDEPWDAPSWQDIHVTIYHLNRENLDIDNYRTEVAKLAMSIRMTKTWPCHWRKGQKKGREKTVVYDNEKTKNKKKAWAITSCIRSSRQMKTWLKHPNVNGDDPDVPFPLECTRLRINRWD